jgi:general stress protein 26
MTELEEKIWKILDRPQTAALATISESGAPWVRYVTIRAAGDFTLNFCTARSTRKAREIAANPAVHLTCGSLQPPDGSAFLQIAGRAEIHSDAAIRLKYWQEGWRRYFKGADDPDYIMVFVHPSRIEYNAPGSAAPEIWTK